MNGIIYNGGDEIVIHRNYVEQFLRENEETIDDEDFRTYMINSDNMLLEEIAKMTDEYIGLYIHPMDGCLCIDQSLLEIMEE